uniref:Uncharacterized protein n=1 Tax=Arundo donax TaxID=35708 RepID=A0A0A9HAV9_ARUDO
MFPRQLYLQNVQNKISSNAWSWDWVGCQHVGSVLTISNLLQWLVKSYMDISLLINFVLLIYSRHCKFVIAPLEISETTRCRY